MPRAKEFDPDGAVDAAMRVFWEKGYQGTSAQDLCDCTGLGRSSIYATFASKRALYLRALRRYDAIMAERREALLTSQAPLADRLRTVLTSVIDDELGDGPHGCFALNAAVEFGGRDAQVTELAEGSFQRLRTALRGAITVARAAGELCTDADPAALADHVHCSMNGLRIMARTTRDRARLTSVRDTILATLPWAADRAS